MEKIVQSTNFFNASDDDANAFQEKIHDSAYDELNADQVNRAFDALAEKLKTDKWPSRNEPGSDMLSFLCNRLRNCLK